MGTDEVVDFFDEVRGGNERAATDGALSDEGEEAFDLVEPGGIGGREVNVPTRTACEPSSDLGMLVGGVVVDDDRRRAGPARWPRYDAARLGIPDGDGEVALGDDRAVSNTLRAANSVVVRWRW